MIQNGEVWQQKRSLLQARTQWIDEDMWILLSTPMRASHGGSAMVAHSDQTGRMLFTEHTLERLLQENEWVKVDVSLERTRCDLRRF